MLVYRRSPTPVMVMGMTRVNEVAYRTVGVGGLKITNTSDGNGELTLECFSVRDFHLNCPNLNINVHGTTLHGMLWPTIMYKEIFSIYSV